MKPSITISIQCHNFQKRLCLMLSSLLAQKKQSRYNLTVDVANYNGNGNPSTKELIEYFNKLGLNVKNREYNNYERFKYRGFTRNDQIGSCDSDFMIFSDSDMIFHNRFFYRLIELITTDERYVDFGGIMTCGRWSQDNSTISNTNVFVDNLESDKPIYIKEVWKQAYNKLNKVRRSNVGAGFFQLINMKKCNHGGIYVPEDSCKDYDWESKGQKAKSDRQFRKIIGIKKKLPLWYSEAQIHLNHFRDNQEGYHLEEQR